MADEEGFRLGALITGPLNWKNHLKVGVFLAIIFIWVCIYGQVQSWLRKDIKPSVGVINSGGAPVDNSTKKSFWSLFYFGGQNQ